MFCPECVSINLVEGSIDAAGVKLDYCPGCKGIWFDQAEMESVIKYAIEGLVVPGDAAETGRGCPRCDRKVLYRLAYPQTEIMVDVCKKCRGVWLDAGEAEAINQARQALGQARLATDPAKEGSALQRFFGHVYDFMCKYGG